MIVHLCLGSNQRNPKMQVMRATRRLAEDQRIRVLRKSSLQRSAPYGGVEQPDFRNQVLAVETDYSPEELLCRLLSLEKELGRVRRERWGPRVIDLDILLYGELILNTPELVLPHPDFHNRRFALGLLCELDPELRHPVLQKTMRELLIDLDSKEEDSE